MHDHPTHAGPDPADRKPAILRALRHGPLDEFQLAADLGAPPSRIRAELAALAKAGYVQRPGGERRWRLTDRGERLHVRGGAA
ncbi:MAG: helix-turn-helix domain-containing protein [Acidimicrobiales bacterium]